MIKISSCQLDAYDSNPQKMIAGLDSLSDLAQLQLIDIPPGRQPPAMKELSLFACAPDGKLTGKIFCFAH